MYLQVNNAITTKDGFCLASFIIKLAGAWYPRQPIKFSGQCYQSFESFNNGTNHFLSDINTSGSFIPTQADIQTESYEALKAQLIEEQGWSESSLIIISAV